MPEFKQRQPLKKLSPNTTRFSLTNTQKKFENEKEMNTQINHFFDRVFNKKDKRLTSLLQFELKGLENNLEKQRKIDAEEGWK